MCQCTFDNVVDRFSFTTSEVFRAVFKILTPKYAGIPVHITPERIKNREDESKTCYTGGVVLSSFKSVVKNK